MVTERKKRLASVDSLRGLAVAVMIVVNNPGDRQHVFPQLRHAAWNGLTLADCVFPLFLFLVGVSVGLAVDRDRAPAGLWPKAVKRAGILFALGLLENAYWRFSFESLRVPGVLQRIALVYLAAVWAHARLSRRAVAAVVLTILLGYWLLLAGSHWLMDLRGRAAWAKPLTMLGTNALPVYVVASFLAASLRHIQMPGGPGGPVRLQAYLHQGLFPRAHSELASLGWSVLFLLVMGLGAWALYARRIVIKL